MGEMELNHIPENVGKLTALRTLNLKRNNFTELPSGFWSNFPDLQILNASLNKLAFIPINLCYLDKVPPVILTLYSGSAHTCLADDQAVLE